MDVNQQLIDDLKAGRAVIENPDKWTQNAWARMPGGALIYRTSKSFAEAECYCAVGAIWKVIGSTDANDPDAVYRLGVAIDALDTTVWREMDKGGGIVLVNDDNLTTHELIMSIYDKTIKRLEKK
jgi:hypothetical protein